MAINLSRVRYYAEEKIKPRSLAACKSALTRASKKAINDIVDEYNNIYGHVSDSITPEIFEVGFTSGLKYPEKTQGGKIKISVTSSIYYKAGAVTRPSLYRQGTDVRLSMFGLHDILAFTNNQWSHPWKVTGNLYPYSSAGSFDDYQKTYVYKSFGTNKNAGFIDKVTSKTTRTHLHSYFFEDLNM